MANYGRTNETHSIELTSSHQEKGAWILVRAARTHGWSTTKILQRLLLSFYQNTVAFYSDLHCVMERREREERGRELTGSYAHIIHQRYNALGQHQTQVSLRYGREGIHCMNITMA